MNEKKIINLVRAYMGLTDEEKKLFKLFSTYAVRLGYNPTTAAPKKRKGKRGHKRWSKGEQLELSRLAAKKTPIKTIAGQLGRTMSAVKFRLYESRRRK